MMGNLAVRKAQFSRAAFLKSYRYEAFIHIIKLDELIYEQYSLVID